MCVLTRSVVVARYVWVRLLEETGTPLSGVSRRRWTQKSINDVPAYDTLFLIGEVTIMVKVVALNASPRMDHSNTSLILNPFLDGLKAEGADVELHYVRHLRIQPCLGDFACMSKTPGQCVQRDEMATLLPAIQRADIVVFATPLYVDGMTGPLKNLIDRLIPLLEPLFELRDGCCRHPPRLHHSHAKVVLVSNCGFWERAHFDPLIRHLQAICVNYSWTYAGALLRPHGPVLKEMLNHGAPVHDVVEAAKTAGHELARDGKMQAATLNAVSCDLLPRDAYIDYINEGAQKTQTSRRQG